MKNCILDIVCRHKIYSFWGGDLTHNLWGMSRGTHAILVSLETGVPIMALLCNFVKIL